MTWALVVAALVLAAGCAAHYRFGYSALGGSGRAKGLDDAYISFRYARNLAEGSGLVYNPGERVEGYSNLLWVLMSASAMAAGADPYPVAACVGTLLSIASLLVVYSLARRSLGDAAAVIAAALFALCPAVWLWSTSGMETPLVLLAQLVMVAAASRVVRDDGTSRTRWRPVAVLCAAAAVSVLTRCDGFIVPTIVIAWLAYRREWRAALAVGVTLAGVFGAYETWRIAYYGDLWPNTFYAKVAGALIVRVWAGARQLAGLMLRAGLLLPVGALAAAFILRLRRDRGRLRFDDALFVGLGAYWFYTGGDVFDERFLLIAYPLGAVAALGLAVEFRVKGALVAAGALALAAQWVPLAADGRYAYTTDKYDMWVTLGEFLRDRRVTGTFAIDAAGKVPFITRLATIDMLGLNDRTIARKKTLFGVVGHSKFDADYVLGRKPDFICAWTGPDGSLGWGLRRVKYELAGYKLAWLVNATPRAEDPNLVSVWEADNETISRLFGEGYTYGVAVHERFVEFPRVVPEASAIEVSGVSEMEIGGLRLGMRPKEVKLRLGPWEPMDSAVIFVYPAAGGGTYLLLMSESDEEGSDFVGLSLIGVVRFPEAPEDTCKPEVWERYWSEGRYILPVERRGEAYTGDFSVQRSAQE